MGISIDLHVLDYKQIMQNLKDEGCDDEDRINQILDVCGHRLGDKYVILNNEYGEMSPWYNLEVLLMNAFDVGRETGGLSLSDVDGWLEGVSTVDLEDAAEKLGITIKEDD